MLLDLRRLFGLISLVAMCTAPLTTEGFDGGDIYLLSGPTVGSKVVHHVDPDTLALTVFTTVPDVNANVMTYDAFRNRLVFKSRVGNELIFVDEFGDYEILPFSSPYGLNVVDVAATGDGRIFLMSISSYVVSYLDECDQVRAIESLFGDAPYVFWPPISSSVMRVIFDADSNGLIVIGSNSGSTAAETVFTRLQLDESGTKLTAPPTSVAYDAALGGQETTASVSGGPGGSFLFTTFPSSGAGPRAHVQVDPATLAATDYASATTTPSTGSYHTGLDQSLIVQFNWTTPSLLISYDLGQTGAGTILLDTLAPQTTAMVVVGDVVAGVAPIGIGSPDCDGNGTPDACDIAAGTAADCNDNGVPDSCDIAAGIAVDADGNGIIDDCDLPDAFLDGELYLAAGVAGTNNLTIRRLDTDTRQFQDLTSLTGVRTSFFGHDPFRERMVFKRWLEPEIVLVDAAGNEETVLYSGFVNILMDLAPSTSGNLYLVGASSAGTNPFGYLDPCDEFHLLLDETGLAPYTFGEGYSVERMIYDEATNSLVVAGITGSGIGSMVQISKLPLSGDGTEVTGPVTTIPFAVAPTSLDVVGMSAGPADSIFIAVDINGSSGPQLFTVDPVTMLAEAFANPFDGTLLTGTYHSDLGLGMTASTEWIGSSIRSFSVGDSGEGPIVSWSISSVHGMLSIGDTLVGDASPPTGLDCNENGVRDVCDIQTGTSLDCNMNGIPDDCELADGSAVDTNGNGILDECEAHFTRGDANGDGLVQVSDVIATLGLLFISGEVPCRDACDVDDDDELLVNDPVLLLSYLFQSGLPPAAPFPDCGVDGTGVDVLGCEVPLVPCP